MYQGAINQGRRVRELIAAIEHAPEWEVWIAGKGDEEETIKSWSKTLHYQHRIKWLGMLSKSELAKATKQAKVGYNGLDWKNSKSYEFSLANKFFDYVSLGIPVITAPTPTYRAMLQTYNVGWLEDDSIVSILDRIEKEPLEYQNRVDACTFARKIWTWENQWMDIQQRLP
jgi:glycosyltransferase involved in cell wall biosynthesis